MSVRKTIKTMLTQSELIHSLIVSVEWYSEPDLVQVKCDLIILTPKTELYYLKKSVCAAVIASKFLALHSGQCG